jgi:hypothetical protein
MARLLVSAAQATSYGVARAIRPLLTAFTSALRRAPLQPKATAMSDLTILHGAWLNAVGQAKENGEKNQAVAGEMVRANVDAVFESACRFIVMKSLPGWVDEICTEHLEAVRPTVRAE